MRYQLCIRQCRHRRILWPQLSIIRSAIKSHDSVAKIVRLAYNTDIYYLMYKALHSAEETKKVLGVLLNLFEILDTGGIDCRKALTSDISDYEDAVMIEAAARAEIDCIVTRNLKDYAGAPMPVYSPAQFVELLYADED